MKKIILLAAFALTNSEKEFLKTLPRDTDDKPAAPDVRRVANIYYRIFSDGEHGERLLQLAKSYKWDDGSRRNTFQAQRMVLDHLYSINISIQPEDAAEAFSIIRAAVMSGDEIGALLVSMALDVEESEVKDAEYEPIPFAKTEELTSAQQNAMAGQHADIPGATEA